MGGAASAESDGAAKPASTGTVGTSGGDSYDQSKPGESSFSWMFGGKPKTASEMRDEKYCGYLASLNKVLEDWKNEILKNEIAKRKSEELSSQPRVPKVKPSATKGSAGESTGPSSSSSSDSDGDEESEYEIEEIYQLQEWYPPDHWRSGATAGSGGPGGTMEVTANNCTVTMVESRSSNGFLMKEMRIEADPSDFRTS